MNDLSALHDMTLFVEVARHASFSRASAQLGMPSSTLSRRIGEMERRFGLRLLHRTTRKVELTEVGRRYFERCAPLVEQARLAQEALRGSADLPGGHVRVSMPVDLGVHLIGPLVPAFLAQFPAITLDLDLSPNNRDLVSAQVDVAIRIGALAGDQLVVRRLGAVAMGLFAAPGYLKRHGRPTQPGDLERHHCVALPAASHKNRWRLQRGQNIVEVVVGGRLALNNLGLMGQLAEQGLGIAALSTTLVSDSLRAGRLVPVLKAWSLPPLPVHAVMMSRLQPACVRAWVDYLAEQLPLR
jgi:DNA-binding transcriptional LysR family regulator